MSSKSVWIIAGAVLVGGALLGAAHLSAQKPVRRQDEPGVRPSKPTGQVVHGFAQVGRYSVVKHDAFNNIILLDTATGDIYKVAPEEFKKYADRPTGRPSARPVAKDKGKKSEVVPEPEPEEIP